MDRDRIDQLQDDWETVRPDLDTEPMGVVLRVQALARIFNDQASDRLEEFDLQWWQYDVLSTLRRQGEPYAMAATELADANRLTSGAMTNRIDRLQDADLILRREDPEDRRRVIVQLTRRGMSLIEKATEVRFESATAAIASLSHRDRDQLSQLLRKVLLAQEQSC